MRVSLRVRNFAKIEHAEICIDSYTLLVGQNNSGKTFLMQLVQGVNEKFPELIDGNIEMVLEKEHTDKFDRYLIAGENISRIMNYVNEQLRIKKESLIKEIFGKDIPIEELYVTITEEENCVYEIIVSEYNRLRNGNFEEFPCENQKYLSNWFEKHWDNWKIAFINIIDVLENKRISGSVYSAIGYAESSSHLNFVLGHLLYKRSLFLPSSRTGLMLLYREYFLNKTDDAILYRINDTGIAAPQEGYGGLTKPMYEFLRFLQTFSESESALKNYRDELLFFDNNLIDGHIDVSKQGALSYRPNSDSGEVPMYLTSSMVNEIAPILLALTGQNRYERLIIDEIEASLHPEKQTELVRFLNRLCNKGMNLIISTHSDTFVSKVNNLCLLSQYVSTTKQEDVLNQFGLEKEDLLDPERIYAYEFMNQASGKSIVKEIKADEKTGYQFDLFTGSALKLYDEASKTGDLIRNAEY